MKYRCPTCGYIYDEAVGFTKGGVPPGTRWERLPGHWSCPQCRARKLNFIPLQTAPSPPPKTDGLRPTGVAIEDATFHEGMREMSFAEVSALCSGLAGSCKRQYLYREAEQFMMLADYYRAHTPAPAETSVDKLLTLTDEDLAAPYARAKTAADAANDRGAKRILTWSERVTKRISSILTQYKGQRDVLLQNTNIYICEVCGYIFIGDTLPRGCPVCHVSNIRISQVE